MTNQPPNLEHLQDGLSSPFWAWFSEYVTREWGPAGLRYQQAVKSAAESQDAVRELQKVIFAQEQVYALMQHPAAMLQRYRSERKAALLPHTASRRGPGL